LFVVFEAGGGVDLWIEGELVVEEGFVAGDVGGLGAGVSDLGEKGGLHILYVLH
jgi:hypothetical protein